jgi:hypothetical protein
MTVPNEMSLIEAIIRLSMRHAEIPEPRPCCAAGPCQTAALIDYVKSAFDRAIAVVERNRTP